MTEELCGETRDLLLQTARSEGYEVSDTQLARWHRFGLIPSPRQHSLGKGRGTETVYPHGSARHLVAACNIHRHERRLPHVAWRLWWVGYPIPADVIRDFLRPEASTWDAVVRLLRSETSQRLSKVALTFIAKASQVRLSKTPLPQARRRTGGPQNFHRFIRVMIEIAVGSFSGYSSEEDAHAVEKGLGLERGRVDRIGEVGPWLDGDTGTLLKELSELLVAHPLIQVLDATSDEELEGALHELRRFIDVIGTTAVVFDHFFGKGSFGFSTVRTALKLLGAQQQGMVLLAWLMFAKYGSDQVRSGMDAYLTLEPEVKLMRKNARMLALARKEIPGFSDLFTQKEIKRAIRYPHRMTYLLNQIRARRNTHLREVESFVERHPEFRALHADGGVKGGTVQPIS